MGRKKKQIPLADQEEVISWLAEFGGKFESDDFDGQTGVFSNGKMEVVAIVEGDLLEVTCDSEKSPRYYRLCSRGFADIL